VIPGKMLPHLRVSVLALRRPIGEGLEIGAVNRPGSVGGGVQATSGVEVASRASR
jgi:hypothetical protein